MSLRKGLLFIFFFFISLNIFSQAPIAVKIYKASSSGKGAYLGLIIARNTSRGLLLVPRLHDLSPGHHGFHLHENPSCQNAAKAAGSHWDPKKTKSHRGPYRPKGHQGDLPALVVDPSGLARKAVLVPRLTVADLKGHALVIHKGGDNYTDQPPNGGGGVRIACGVVP